MLRDHVVPLYLTLFPLFSISLSLQHLSIYLSIIYLSSIDQSKHNWPNHIKNNNNNKPTLARTRAWTVKKDASLKSVKAKCLSSGFRDWGYQTRYRDEYVQTCSMDSTFDLLHLVLPLYSWIAIILLLFSAIFLPSLSAQPYNPLLPTTLPRLSKFELIFLSFNCGSNYRLYCYLAITHMISCNIFFYVNSYSNLIWNFLKLFEKYFILLAHTRHLTNVWLIEVGIS